MPVNPAIHNAFALSDEKIPIVPDAPPHPIPPAPAIPGSPTPLKAEQADLGAGTDEGEGGADQSSRPLPPAIDLSENTAAPIPSYEPKAADFMHGKDFPAPHKVEVPSYDTSFHFQQVTPPAKPHFFEDMTRGAGQLAAGVGGGGVQVADTLKALIETPRRINESVGAQASAADPLEPWRKNVPLAPYHSWQNAYENAVGKDTVKSGPYGVGKAIGEMGSYAATSIGAGAAAVGLGAPVAAGVGLGLGAAALEGGVVGLAQSAQEQLRGGAKQLDAGQLGMGAGLGTAFGLGGGALGQGAKYLVGKAWKAYTTSRAAKKAADTVADTLDAEHIQRQADSERALDLMEQVKKELNHMEADALEKFHEMTNTPAPAENALQRKQMEALKKTTDEATNPDGTMAPFRLRVRKLGYEQIDYALDLSEVRPLLPQPVYKALKEAVEALGHAKASWGHASNDVEAYVRNVLKLAKRADQRAQIETIVGEPRLHSGPRRELDKLKTELFTKQEQERKALLEARKAEAEADFATAPRKFRAELQALITELDEALNRLSDPAQMYKITKDKGLYGIANRHELESPTVPRDLKPTFAAARDQFRDAVQHEKAEEKQYEAMSKHYLPVFEQAELAYQRATNDFESRLWVKTEITNPFSRKVTTDYAVGLKHNPFTAILNGIYHKEFKAAEEAAMAIEGNVVREVTYRMASITGRPLQSGKDAKEILRNAGTLHPVAEKLSLAIALGLPSLDLPANAADNMSEKQERHFFGNVGFALVGTILASKYGPTIARRIIRNPSYYFLRCFANTRDLTKFSDAALGISPTLNPKASLARNIDELGGKVLEAITAIPDHTEYFMQSLRKQVDGKELSDPARAYYDDIHDKVKALKSFIPEYKTAWVKHYNALSEADKDYLKPVNAAVHFVANTFGVPRHGDISDGILAKLFTGATRAIFTMRPKTFISQVADVAISGPLQVGPVATHKAYQTIATNPVIRGLVNKAVKAGGAVSQNLKEVSESAKPLPAEQIQARTMLLASFFHYFDTHPNTMQGLGIKKGEDLAEHVLTGRLDSGTYTVRTPTGSVQLPKEDVKADIFIQAYVDAASVTGADSLMLNYDWIGRTAAGQFYRWASQPMRTARLLAVNTFPDLAEPGVQGGGKASLPALARLIMVNGAKGNIPWVLGSLGVLWQFGGQAVIPKSWQLAGYRYQPEATANVIAFINMTSMGQHLLGNMSSSVDYDPFLAPLMGTMAPGMDTILGLISDSSSASDHMGDVIRAINARAILHKTMEGDIEGAGGEALSAPERAARTFLGNKAVESNEKAQHALYTLMNDFSIAAPTLGGIPTQALSSFLYHLPEVIHGNLRVAVPHPVIGSTNAFPLESTKVQRFKPRPGETQQDADNRARIAAFYSMLRMGDTLDVTNFKNARIGVHYQGSPTESLRGLEHNSL